MFSTESTQSNYAQCFATAHLALIRAHICGHVSKYSGVCIAYICSYMCICVCVCAMMTALGSVLLLRAAKEFMLFCPSSIPRLLAILGKSKLQSFSMWLACAVPNLYFTYPSCSILLSPPFFISPILLNLPYSNDTIYFASLICIYVYFLNKSYFFKRVLNRAPAGRTTYFSHQMHDFSPCIIFSFSHSHTITSSFFLCFYYIFLFSCLVVLYQCLLLCRWS